jgi:hypothetical protein
MQWVSQTAVCGLLLLYWQSSNLHRCICCVLDACVAVGLVLMKAAAHALVSLPVRTLLSVADVRLRSITYF